MFLWITPKVFEGKYLIFCKFVQCQVFFSYEMYFWMYVKALKGIQDNGYLIFMFAEIMFPSH